MGLDYYNILGLDRSCTQDAVKKSYRRLALKYNPEKYGNDENMRKIFSLIAEAYDVLVDHKRRAVYDQYGEEGLKGGVPGPTEYIQPYCYHGEPLRTYNEFFATSNPYADILDYYQNPPPMFESPLGKGYKEKDPPIIRPLLLTLEEIFTGCLKKMKIQRLVFTDEMCTELKLRDKVLSIPIRPGTYPKTEIKFKEEGDQGPTRIPADVIFVTEDRPHEVYKRLGKSDLVTTKVVTLEEALCGITLTLPTLDNRTLRVQITDTISPKYEKVVEGEGLPLAPCPTKARGNLVIRFNVQFPEYFGKRTKQAFQDAFRVMEDEEEQFNNLECGTLPQLYDFL